MNAPKTIKIKDGMYGKNEYYYWDEYESWEEAIYNAKKIKEERRRKDIRIKYFIIETKDSWFLPVPKFILYFNKDIKQT